MKRVNSSISPFDERAADSGYVVPDAVRLPGARLQSQPGTRI